MLMNKLEAHPNLKKKFMASFAVASNVPLVIAFFINTFYLYKFL